jgi:hypothetical protein
MVIYIREVSGEIRGLLDTPSLRARLDSTLDAIQLASPEEITEAGLRCPKATQPELRPVLALTRGGLPSRQGRPPYPPGRPGASAVLRQGEHATEASPHR